LRKIGRIAKTTDVILKKEFDYARYNNVL
jgi:hypothetical protein